MRLFLVVMICLSLYGCRKSLHDLNTVIKRVPAPEVAED
jgi:hypothetical protein